MLKNIKRALVFVESPFQLTNLVDFADYQPSTQMDVVVRFNGDEKNDRSIRRLLNNLNQENISIHTLKISRSGKLKIIEMLKLITYFPSVIAATNVIFFDDRGIVFKVLRRFIRGSIILGDDGAYSFIKVRELEKNNKYRISGFITKFKELQSSDLDVLYIPSASKEVGVSDYTLIIGMPLFEKGIVSEEDHLSAIRTMVLEAKSRTGSRVFYFPHRSEYLYRKMDVPVVDSELSVEEYIDGSDGNAPLYVISMYSTALFVISSRFKGPVCYYYKLPQQFIKNKESTRNIAAVYDALERSPCKELL